MANLNLDHVFQYHSPDATQAATYVVIRDAAKAFAATVQTFVPDCADRTTALRTIREAVMWANAAVALQGNL